MKKLPFKNKFILAPMLEPNDIAFRLLCKKAGAGGIYSGMINPHSKKKLDLQDKPIIQLFCTDTKGLEKFIKKYDSKVSGWDFNLGCPSVVAQKLGVGSFMQNNLIAIDSILMEIRRNTKKFLSVKIRKSASSLNILNIAQKYCDAIVIHPRTREQGYSGKADVEFALNFKQQSKIPVIYSGDVNVSNANELLKKFDYLMIGRAAMGNPSIFAVLNCSKKRFYFKDYLLLAKKYKVPFEQIKSQSFCFTKGFEGATKLRIEIMKAKTSNELAELFKDQILQ